tara:strand:- start:1741 stop:1932 length:192 start_codon:yes stop_codon:yes gene_type:complete
MNELSSLKKNVFKLVSKNKLDTKDKKLLDSILKRIKNRYIIVVVKDTKKNIYPVLKRKPLKKI